MVCLSNSDFIGKNEKYITNLEQALWVNMNNWYSKNLGDTMFADESLEKIKEIFHAEFSRNNNFNEMALFFRHEGEGRLHCEVKVFFSPAAFTIAKELNAIPCTKPSLTGLDLLAGSAASWLILFPEKNF